MAHQTKAAMTMWLSFFYFCQYYAKNIMQRVKIIQTIAEALEKLQKSDFRSSFHLRAKDKEYVRSRGMETIRRDAAKFVADRLAAAQPKNDGRQTPMKGHPVFIAQHATGCCCRGCLNKWYHVPRGVPLSAEQQQKIVNLLLAWIEKEMAN